MQTAYTLSAITDTGRDGPKPRRDWSDAELLAEGFAANSSALRALQQRARLTQAQAAELCGVSPRTYRRWLADENAPAGALRLLAVVAGFLPWSGWEGWEVHQGLLFPPGYARGGIPPGEFFALVFYRQQVTAYQDAHAKLKARIESLEAELVQLRGASRSVDLAAASAVQDEEPGIPGSVLSLLPVAGSRS